MSLFEKSLQSFLFNANSALYSGTPAPVLCVADTTPFPSTPILQTILYKLAPPETSVTPTTTGVRPEEDQGKTGPIIVALTHPTHPLFSAQSPHPSVRLVAPPTTPTDHTGPLKTTQWTPQTLIEATYQAITQAQQTSQTRPVVVFLDYSLLIPLALANYTPLEIPALLTALTTIPTVSGVVVSLSTDALFAPSATRSAFDLAAPAPAPAATSAIDVFDNITSVCTTLIQTLPPPPNHPTAILSCRVSHRSSNGKITGDSVVLQPHQTKPILTTTTTTTAAAKDTAQTNPDLAALPEGLQNLPFNLALTAHQMQQRAQVELPYAHQGNTGASGRGQTSATNKFGLLSSTPIRKSAKFDEIIDDEEDEDGEL